MALAWRKPKTGVGCLVRIIDTAPQFGFFVFMPMIFERIIGFAQSQWLMLLSSIFLSNIIWNLIFGLLGDRIAWRWTIAIFGGLGCTATTLAFYYVPVLTHSLHLTLFVGMLYGATLAGYVPLYPPIPSLAPEHKGQALSLLSLGAGASVWVGAAIVGLLIKHFAVVGVMWMLAVLYLISALLTLTLTLPAAVRVE